eukprot:CAMPEP_0194147426 /NCGR_PEP_ID=MMETSP0152-20130528/24638_1 /TAXON_ID=1049557 /ORGANISM="Thalassiothrix antarctica, Strain L6-D1" /LENGTH=75 /DNA_ID=CAMNT_0038848263 /DNA_START=76 /DNA_END=303 /DNA_ORIENTATION=-
MEFQHDRTSRLTATDALMLDNSRASSTVIKRSANSTELSNRNSKERGKARHGNIQYEDLTVEGLKKIKMPKPFAL